MIITEKQIKKLIREALSRILEEQFQYMDDAPGAEEYEKEKSRKRKRQQAEEESFVLKGAAGQQSSWTESLLYNLDPTKPFNEQQIDKAIKILNDASSELTDEVKKDIAIGIVGCILGVAGLPLMGLVGAAAGLVAAGGLAMGVLGTARAIMALANSDETSAVPAEIENVFGVDNDITNVLDKPTIKRLNDMYITKILIPARKKGAMLGEYKTLVQFYDEQISNLSDDQVDIEPT